MSFRLKPKRSLVVAGCIFGALLGLMFLLNMEAAEAARPWDHTLELTYYNAQHNPVGSVNRLCCRGGQVVTGRKTQRCDWITSECRRGTCVSGPPSSGSSDQCRTNPPFPGL